MHSRDTLRSSNRPIFRYLAREWFPMSRTSRDAHKKRGPGHPPNRKELEVKGYVNMDHREIE